LTIKKLTEDTSIFIKFWIFAEPLASITRQYYNIAPLPGGKEGISAASVNGYNVGINNRIEKFDGRRKAAFEVIKYITSKEMQKQLFLNGVIIPAIPSLFDDEEVCKLKDCEMYKNFQPILDVSYEFYDKYKYEEKYGKLASSYVFKNKDLSNIINKIEEIDRIYYVSLGSEDHYIGLIIVIFVFAFSILTLLSLIFTFMENFHPFFKNLSKDSWFLIIIGIILMLCSTLTRIGMLSVIKCHLKILFTSIGLMLYLSNILYELTIHFPIRNKISKWIKNNKYLFLSFFLLMDFIINGLMMINPFIINNIIVENGRNFQVCEMNASLGKSMIFALIIDKFLIFLILSFLIFIEWNIQRIYYEVRFIFTILYSNILLIVIAVIFDLVPIINYFGQFLIQEGVVIFTSVTSYIFLYGYRLFLAFMYKRNMRLNSINIKSDFLKTQTKNEYYITNSSTIGGNNNSYIDSYYNNNINTEQMIVSSPPRFFTKMYNHYLKESSDNLNRSF